MDSRSNQSANEVSGPRYDKYNKVIHVITITCSKLEQRRLDELAYRQNLAKSIEKTSQESEKMLAEARQEKMRYLEEFHSAQKKVSDLQSHLKDLQSHVVEKDALIRALQIPKGNFKLDNAILHILTNQMFFLPGCGSSFDDSWPLNASNASFNTSMDQNFGPSNHMSSSSSSLLPNSEAAAVNYPGYLRTSDYGTNFRSANSPSTSPSLTYTNQQMLRGYDNRALAPEPGHYNVLLDSQAAQLGLMTRKSAMEDHLLKKEFDKVSAASASNKSDIILAQIQTSREIAKSCRDMMAATNENETFY